MAAVVDVCLSPALLEHYFLAGKIVVVVDIFRAGSCMTTGLAFGVEKIKPVSRIEEARKFEKEDYLLAGERDGIPIDGFDLSNSPYDFMWDKLKGRSLAMTTTNGTFCLKKSEEAGEQVIGSFLNFSATVNYLSARDQDVVILCAGWNGSVNLEDTLYAGNLVEALAPGFEPGSDSCRMAHLVFRQAQDNMRKFLNDASHVKRLQRLNYERDIDYCLERDRFDFPVGVRDGFVVKL